MKIWLLNILFVCVSIAYTQAAVTNKIDSIRFFERPFIFEKPETVSIPDTTTESSIKQFYENVNTESGAHLIVALQAFKKENNLNDWIYYQLVRAVAESISPKNKNYHRYTLYKWYLMSKSGYDARLALGDNQIIFYILNKEDISDIPFFYLDGKQYTCLNYHDYGKLFKQANTYKPISINIPEATNDFSYKINYMPEFSKLAYSNKTLNFKYNNKVYNFNIKVNDELTSVFKNYPGVDFESYFNIPLTKETYQSLIPVLKENVKNMNTVKGVDYLMRFTRYAFLYENDDQNFGTEKRLSPELTLMNAYSDCDDRVALFFYLVKEIYNLPMVAILYPTHITMGVQFEKKIGQSIKFEDQYYTICEPTPQDKNLNVGQLSDKYINEQYKVVYHYAPK